MTHLPGDSRPIAPPGSQGALTCKLLTLFNASCLHQRYTVQDICRRVLPSLESGQYVYCETTDGQPVAFVNWAFVSDRALEELLNASREILPTDWQSGPNLFFPEFLAPFGNCRPFIRHLRRNFFHPGVIGWSQKGGFYSQKPQSFPIRKFYF